MEVTRSGFYKYFKKQKTPLKKEEIQIVVAMKAIAKETRGSYGKRRYAKKLQDYGHNIGVHATRTLMIEQGIESTQRRARRKYFGPKEPTIIGENKLNRIFKVALPNMIWCVDITYIETEEGTLYLAGVLDLFSRKIVGYAMSENMTEELVAKALKMATNTRKIKNKKTLHHSDQGSQYVAKTYQKFLKKKGFIVSLSRKGKCIDNAVKERFWGSLKSEWTSQKKYKTRKEATLDIIKYIDFYNSIRLHSTLGYVSPNVFEANFRRN